MAALPGFTAACPLAVNHTHLLGPGAPCEMK